MQVYVKEFSLMCDEALEDKSVPECSPTLCFDHC